MYQELAGLCWSRMLDSFIKYLNSSKAKFKMYNWFWYIDYKILTLFYGTCAVINLAFVTLTNKRNTRLSFVRQNKY